MRPETYMNSFFLLVRVNVEAKEEMAEVKIKTCSGLKSG